MVANGAKPIADGLKAFDEVRNAALAKSDAYHAKYESNKEFNIHALVLDLVGEMPILTSTVAKRLKTQQVDLKNQTLPAPIYGEIV